MTYRFDEIAINSTAKKKPVESDKFHYVGLEHIDSGSFEITRWGSDVAPVGEKLIMQKGDVLFGKRRAYQRKVAIAPFDGIFSAHGMVLRPKEDVICKEFFPFFLSSNQFMDTAIRISVGGLSPTINWKDLQKQEFELPSVEEQRILAEKLWAAYELKEAYKKMIAATDEMVKSQFIEMSKAWPVMKLNGHVDIIRGVSYKPSDVVSSLDANSVGILRANNIANGEINTNEMVYVDQSRVSDAQRIRIGDIIVCASSGSQSLVGKAAINKNLTREYAHGAFCLLIRCNNPILPKYLNIYLHSALYRNQIESLSCGSNILNIKAGHLTSLDIPIPDIKQQSDFVTIIEQADKSKFELRQAIEKIDKVMKSLINDIK